MGDSPSDTMTSATPSSGTPGKSGPSRRKHLPPERRRRVAIACTNCNLRRIKCSGDDPCAQCVGTTRECRFPSVASSAVSRAEMERLRERCSNLERCLEEVVPDAIVRQTLLRSGASPSGSESAMSVTKSQTQEDVQATTGRLLRDPDGAARFLGGSSGATFLDHVRELMLTLSPLATPRLGPTAYPDTAFVEDLGRYQTQDSRPLHEPDVDPHWLPSRTEMTIMMAEFRYLLHDGNGDFASGGTYWWGDLSTDSLPPPSLSALSSQSSPAPLRLSGDESQLALHNVAFALACQMAQRSSDGSDGQLGAGIGKGDEYFRRARILVKNPLDLRLTTPHSIGEAMAMALMGFYLLEINRRDAAYMYVSTAVHISIMLGGFRGCKDEKEKRALWTLYVLDSWLSCIMGRPPTIVNDSIHLPSMQDVPGLPPAAGLRAHVQLADISNYVVCNAYKIAPWDHRPTSQCVATGLQMLEQWKQNLPAVLQLSPSGTTADPSCIHLHMNHNQLILLSTRPILLVAVKKSLAQRYTRRWHEPTAPSSTYNIQDHPNSAFIRACCSAARANMELAKLIVRMTRERCLLHMSIHNIFNAALVMLLERLMLGGDVDTNTDAALTNIQFAIAVIRDEAMAGGNDFRIDCYKVLRDLNALVDRLARPAVQRQTQVIVPVPVQHARDERGPSSETGTDTTYPPMVPQVEGSFEEPFDLGLGDGNYEGLYDQLSAWMESDDWHMSNYFST